MGVLESILVFGAVLAAVVFLVWRQAKKRRAKGCGGTDCGCPVPPRD